MLNKEGYIEVVKTSLGSTFTSGLIEWLDSIHYFTAPAAKKHHGAKKHGLVVHSLQVAAELRALTDSLNLQWMRPESPEIVGILHDVCKTNDYIWDTDVEDIAWNDHQIMSGHGDKSVIMLAGHFNLTEEEAACIQFHMGAFTAKEQWQYYSEAIKRWPNVLYAHTADMIASQIKGI